MIDMSRLDYPRIPISDKHVNKPVNTQGHFSDKTESMANYRKLLQNLELFQILQTVQLPGLLADLFGTKNAKENLDAVYEAIESGVAIPNKPAEHTSVLLSKFFRQAYAHLQNPSRVPFPTKHNFFSSESFSLPEFSNDEKAELKLKLQDCKNDQGSYDPDALKVLQEEVTSKMAQRQEYKEKFSNMKSRLSSAFKQDPQLLFEKAAAYPETVRRLVDVLDLPVQNDKGWNLTSQVAKAGNPKLAKAFESAGFGPNLHTKVVVDFAKTITEDAPNAQKSAALKELMGITPLS